ncbi:hypothetical protein ACVWZB_003006 [Paenibacillus polymyxa]|uniref:Uncharacterized protein n=1 Tax=Paenibacillus polymyxa TaxID=1406 RepID=A0A378XRQ5_PAEPO|nr:hypothetical protein SAMN04488600_1011401 [Paenibacillus polymyxa]SUA64059.1 Uncharacterised protein [Paenibacillus polymyxa]
MEYVDVQRTSHSAFIVVWEVPCLSLLMIYFAMQ